MSANEWTNAITQALRRKEEKVPDGWLTAFQLRKVFDASQEATSRKIRTLKESGLIEQKRFKITTNRGLYPEIHYKLIKKK